MKLVLYGWAEVENLVGTQTWRQAGGWVPAAVAVDGDLFGGI